MGRTYDTYGNPHYIKWMIYSEPGDMFSCFSITQRCKHFNTQNSLGSEPLTSWDLQISTYGCPISPAKIEGVSWASKLLSLAHLGACN